MRNFGARIAKELIAQPLGEHAKIAALTGDLGAGKTTFTQGFLKQLGVKRRVISPTFVLIRNYKLQLTNYSSALHIDCYRLHKPGELLALGLKDILNNSGHIVLIEWPELIEELLPAKILRITIEHPKKGSARTVSVS